MSPTHRLCRWKSRCWPEKPHLWLSYPAGSHCRERIAALFLTLLCFGFVSCRSAETDQASAAGPGREQRGGQRGERGEAQSEQPAVVEILQATGGSLDDGESYTGSTEPRQQVEVKSQLTAQILSLPLDVGDRVTQGEVIAQLDPKLLRATLSEAEAELAVRQAELSEARSSAGETEAAIGEANAELIQAKADADRLDSLAQSGAIAQQQADQARTAQRVAEQRLRSAQEQLKTKGEAIAAAQQRITAQQAVIVQEQEGLALSQIQAPISGVVLAQQLESGDLAQAGQPLLTLGDLSETQVVIEVTDQARGNVQLGQAVQVQLDAFPGQTFTGRVTQISPVADAASRLIPVEILLDTAEPIGSGLLARVRLDSAGGGAISVPQTALEISQADNPGATLADSKTATIFVVEATNSAQVQARTVSLGKASNGQIEITSGLSSGALYVAKSDQPLSNGQTIRRSLASEF